MTQERVGTSRTGSTRAGDIVVANAPVSYGAFELTVGILPDVPDAATVLDEVAGAGYAGIDLGPLGYLGYGEELSRNLSSRGLALAGGFFELPFSDLAKMPRALKELGALLDVFDAVRPGPGGLKPRPTLADAGSATCAAHVLDRPRRTASSGSTKRAGSISQKASKWRSRVVGSADTSRPSTTSPGPTSRRPGRSRRCSSSPRSVSAWTPATCCWAAATRSQAMREWGERINHVHFKDARRAVVDRIVRESAHVERDLARARRSAGSAKVTSTSTGCSPSSGRGYSGWLVVEQDMLPGPRRRKAAADQRANREYLAARGF